MPDITDLLGLKDSWEKAESQSRENTLGPSGTGEVQDFFGDDNFEAPTYGGDAFDDAASIEGDFEEGGGAYGGGGLGMVAPGERHGPFDPRRNGGELVMALVGGNDGEGMFDYFDKGFGKAWAGAEHWKLTKVSRKGQYHDDPHSLRFGRRRC